MSTSTAVAGRRVRFRAVNVSELLERLVAYGVAREVPARRGVSRAVSVNQIEVAIAADGGERSLRARWRERVGTSGLAYLLVVDDTDRRGSVQVLGPSTVDAPIRSVECARLADVFEAVPDMTSLDAVRHVAGEVDRLAGRGMVVEGLLSRHTLEDRFRNDVERWQEAVATVEPLRIADDWRSVLTGFGYEIERLPQRGWLARRDGRPVAIVHPRANPQDFVRLDEMGRPAEGVLASDCHRHGIRYGILACRNRYRLFDCDPSATTAEWLDLDAALLGEERRPYLALLAPLYLADGGLAGLQQEARDFGARLRRRLDDTIRQKALPALAAGLEQWAHREGIDIRDEPQRSELEQASLTLLFRLLFVLYAESSSFLPVENDTYRRRSLSTLIDEAHSTGEQLSDGSTALWSTFATLVRAGANERDPENLDPDVLFPLADMVSVRRDRRLIEQNYPNTTFPDGTPVVFPTPSLSTERYDLDEAYPGLVREITATIGALTMARYRPSAYGLEGAELSRESSLGALLQSAILKRFESCWSACLLVGVPADRPADDRRPRGVPIRLGLRPGAE